MQVTKRPLQLWLEGARLPLELVGALGIANYKVFIFKQAELKSYSLRKVCAGVTKPKPKQVSGNNNNNNSNNKDKWS